MYHISGMTITKIDKMSYRERHWWLERLYKQRKQENEAMEKAYKRKGKK